MRRRLYTPPYSWLSEMNEDVRFYVEKSAPGSGCVGRISGRALLGAAICLGSMLAEAGESSSEAMLDEEIVVVGMFEDPDRVSGSAHRVEQEVLEAFGHDDVSRILNFVPGVYVREEDGFGLRPNIGLRGGSADRSQKVALMEDSVLFAPAPYSAPAAYFFPLTARMEAVEVFKGPSSIEYGPQTIGGAINFVSAPVPTGDLLDISLGGGSDGYRSAHLRGGTQVGGFGVLAEYLHIGSDGFKSLDGGGDTGFEKNELMLKAAGEVGPGALEIRLGYADEVSDETYLGLTETDARSSPLRRYGASALDRMDWEWFGGRLTWNQSLGDVNLTAVGYLHTFERAWRKFNNFAGAAIGDVLANPDGPFNRLLVDVLEGEDTDGLGGSFDDIRIGTNDRSFLSGGTQLALAWNYSGDLIDHDVRAGLRYHYDEIERLHDEFGYEQLAGALQLNDQGRIITADNTGETHAVSAWIRDQMTFGRWTLVPGLRIEAISNEFDNALAGQSVGNDYEVFLPGIGASVEVFDGFNLLGGVHKGFSPAVPSLSGDLEPEESVNYEFGGRWLNSLGRLEVIGYYSDYSNLTAVCTFSAGCGQDSLDTQTNAGEVITQGIEAGWDQSIRLSSSLTLPIHVSYTYTDAEFEEGFSSTNPQFGDVLPGDELPYIPPHRANASLGLLGSFWDLRLSVTYVDRMRDQAGSGSFTASEGSDSMTIVDLAAQMEVGAHWTLALRVDNVLDEIDIVSRRPFGARPSKPQTFRVEARYQLARNDGR